MTRTPPNDHTLEESVLGSLMFNPALPIHYCEPKHFYTSKNKLIYEAIISLRARGDMCDVSSVVSSLRQRGELEKAGGIGHVASLTTNAMPDTLEQHAKRLVDLWRIRQAILHARTLESHAFSCTYPHELLPFLSAAAKDITEKSQRMIAQEQGMNLVLSEIESASQGHNKHTYKTGFYDLDKHVRMNKGDLIVIAGRPGMGKSSFGSSIARNIAEGFPTIFFSLEMSQSALRKRMLSDASNIPLETLRDGLIVDSDWPKITLAAGSLSTQRLWIDDTPAAGTSYVEGQSIRIRDEHGLDCVVIDHLHRMREPGKWSGSREMYDETLIRLKNLAKNLDICVVLLAQLNRNVEERNPPRPQLSDLRETGRIEEEADTVLMLFRPEYYLRQKTPQDQQGVGYVQVEKQREGRAGFDVRLHWSERHAAYRNLTLGSK